jgi:uncharacterized protein (TIGR02594 family)
VWLEEARRLRGLKEDLSAGSNPVILDWASDLDIEYASDDIPWCGLFVAHCTGATLPAEPLPNDPLTARAWLKFGRACEPVEGAILVFWRQDRNGPFGHVGLYEGEDSDAFHVLGGNQLDSVCSTRLARDRLLGARWPASAASVMGKRVARSRTGALSANEA